MTSKSSRNHKANRLPLELQESYCELALTFFFFSPQVPQVKELQIYET